MQKIVLFLLTLCVIVTSCDKAVKLPLHYTVTNDANDSALQDIFIPDTGNYTMTVKTKFLSGYQYDKVTLVISGVPANVTVTPDTFVANPTFSENFVFHSKNAVHGTYPAVLTASTAAGLPQVYNFNITVIPADCAALYWGTLSFKNACDTRTYSNTATGVSSGTLNTLNISNFSGYGAHCNVIVQMNCDNDSLHITNGDYGNGVVLSGAGIFNNDSMVIWYNAASTPTGGPESCVVTYKRQ